MQIYNAQAPRARTKSRLHVTEHVVASYLLYEPAAFRRGLTKGLTRRHGPRPIIDLPYRP